MKNLLLSILSLFVLLISCKKDNSKESPLSKEPKEVKFNITLADQNNFELPVTSVIPATDSKSGGKLSDYFQRLEYYLYNSKGLKVAQLSMDADESATGFKIPAPSLPEGTYTVVFLGRKEKNTGNSSVIYFGDDLNSPYLAHSLQREVTDLFYASQEFDVNNENTHINVALKRPGGKVKIIIEDDWAPHVERIGMLINGYTLFYPKSDKLAERKDISLPILKNYILTSEIVNGVSIPKQTYVDCSYENFVFTNSSNVTMVGATIIAYDKEDKQISKKTLNEIKVERNKITTVNVKLFNN